MTLRIGGARAPSCASCRRATGCCSRCAHRVFPIVRSLRSRAYVRLRWGACWRVPSNAGNRAWKRGTVDEGIMRCLTDVELQSFADGEESTREASAAITAHVAGCSRCRERVGEVRRQIAAITALVNSVEEMPAETGSRVRHAVMAGRPVRGSTALRAPLPAAAAWRRTGLVSALATAAAIVGFVFGILPRLGAPTTLSASQILGRSLQTLSSARGIELLEYELVVDGLAHGSWRVEQLFDHDRPMHYRVAAYGPDGTLHHALSQDPLRQRRSQLVRVDERNYIVTVGAIPNAVLSLPQMVQALAETAITMMQATSDQNLTVLETSGGRQYIIETPPVAPAATAATLELRRARTVVDGTDFRIQEFEATGTLLRQPFSVSFTLIRRTVRPPSEV